MVVFGSGGLPPLGWGLFCRLSCWFSLVCRARSVPQVLDGKSRVPASGASDERQPLPSEIVLGWDWSNRGGVQLGLQPVADVVAAYLAQLHSDVATRPDLGPLDASAEVPC